MTGAAARIHGYDALDGFGITLIKNQTVEEIPIIRKVIFAGNPLFSIESKNLLILVPFNKLNLLFLINSYFILIQYHIQYNTIVNYHHL